MKSRRKVELAIEDLKRFASGANRDPQRFGGYQVIWNLRRFSDQLASDPANLRELLKVAALLSAGRGPGQGRTEKELFKELTFIAADCGEKLDEHGTPISQTTERLRRSPKPLGPVGRLYKRWRSLPSGVWRSENPAIHLADAVV